MFSRVGAEVIICPFLIISLFLCLTINLPHSRSSILRYVQLRFVKCFARVCTEEAGNGWHIFFRIFKLLLRQLIIATIDCVENRAHPPLFTFMPAIIVITEI